MKVALVCIAKNEDKYIQEWVDYNKKLGFDEIFIYHNDWECAIDEPNITKIEFNGLNKQIQAYNDFIKKYHSSYDWAAFFDVDEFLVLKKHKDIKEFISNYEDYNAVGINWYLFGDNGLTDVTNNYSVLKRFTKRQKKINQHIKSIVKLNDTIVMGVHNPNCEWVDTNKKIHEGPFNSNGDDSVAILHHFFTKTKSEFEIKCNRGRADATIKRTLKEFYDNNFNEIEDLTAYNFMYNDNNNLFNP